MPASARGEGISAWHFPKKDLVAGATRMHGLPSIWYYPRLSGRIFEILAFTTATTPPLLAVAPCSSLQRPKSRSNMMFRVACLVLGVLSTTDAFVVSGRSSCSSCCLQESLHSRLEIWCRNGKLFWKKPSSDHRRCRAKRRRYFACSQSMRHSQQGVELVPSFAAAAAGREGAHGRNWL